MSSFMDIEVRNVIINCCHVSDRLLLGILNRKFQFLEKILEIQLDAIFVVSIS